MDFFGTVSCERKGRGTIHGRGQKEVRARDGGIWWDGHRDCSLPVQTL